MANIILVIHLILAVCLIGVVLLQRSEGGGLGIGGGGGVVTGRSAANALVKITWVLAIGFIVTSIALTILAARNAAGNSVIERLGTDAPAASAPAPASPASTGTPDTPTPPAVPTPAPAQAPAPAPAGGNLLPPAASDAPATPPKPKQ